MIFATDRKGHRLRAAVIAIVAIMAIADWVLAIDAFRHAPAARDLYHIVYPHDPRVKGEDSATFLLAFPAMTTAGLVFMATGVMRGRPVSGRSLALSLLVLGAFSITTVVRCRAVFALFD